MHRQYFLKNMVDKNETRNIHWWNFRNNVVPYLKKSLILKYRIGQKQKGRVRGKEALQNILHTSFE